MSSTQQQLHLWDFDGVLCESLTECLTVVALAVHRRRYPGETISRSTIAKACSEEIVRELDRWMRPLRPFIVRGQDYLWQYDAREVLSERFASREEYQAVMAPRFNKRLDDEYSELFYESRKLLAEAMGEKYLGLFTCYRGAIHALRLSLSRHRSYICTNRDRQAFEKTLAPHQIFVPRSRIFSRDYNGEEENTESSKFDQVRAIIEQTGGFEQQMVLVEDQPELPGKLMNSCPDLKVLYAAYGYGLAEDWARQDSERIVRINRPADLIYELF